jgi:hypothetical protein
MEAKCSSETSVDVRRTARRYIPQYTALSNLYVEDCRVVTVRRFEGTDIFRLGRSADHAGRNSLRV